MRHVPPHALSIGNAGDLQDPSRLCAAEVRAVVDLAANEPLPQLLPRDLTYCRFPLLDGADNDPVVLRLAVRTVAALMAANVPVVVCCSNGMSRSPAIAAAAIGIADRISLEAALVRVASAGTHDVSPALWNDVCAACASL